MQLGITHYALLIDFIIFVNKIRHETRMFNVDMIDSIDRAL